MPLTVKDILEKTFKRSFKGYDENEVDKFLDEIIDEIKALQSDNAALKEALDAEIERAKKTKEAEEAIMHTLVSAQKSAERILAEAAKKAEVIIDSAETTARKRAENTVKELGDAQRKLDDVKGAAKVLARKFNDLISNESASFEKVFRSYFGEIDGGINVKALEKIDEDITESLRGIEEPEMIRAKESVIEKSTPRLAMERPAPRPAVERPAPRPAMESPAPRPAMESPAPRHAMEQPAPRPAIEQPAMEQPAPRPAIEQPAMEQPAPRPAMERPAPRPAMEIPEPEPEVEEFLSEEPVKEEFVNASDYDFEIGSGKLMELTEINKVLSEIENSGEDILQEDYETLGIDETQKKREKRPNAYNSIYDDYSWLYGNEEKDESETAEPGVVFKDPKEKEELESLIDDIIDNKGI